jgi:hypothetical protein
MPHQSTRSQRTLNVHMLSCYCSCWLLIEVLYLIVSMLLRHHHGLLMPPLTTGLIARLPTSHAPLQIESRYQTSKMQASTTAETGDTTRTCLQCTKRPEIAKQCSLSYAEMQRMHNALLCNVRAHRVL